MTNTICDLNKVQYATFHWQSDSGYSRKTKPKGPTVKGLEFDPEAKLFRGHGEGLLSYATRNRLIDTWTPVLRLQFAANHSLRYVGEKALSLWKAWQAKQFGKKQRKVKNEEKTSNIQKTNSCAKAGSHRKRCAETNQGQEVPD